MSNERRDQIIAAVEERKEFLDDAGLCRTYKYYRYIAQQKVTDLMSPKRKERASICKIVDTFNSLTWTGWRVNQKFQNQDKSHLVTNPCQALYM